MLKKHIIILCFLSIAFMGGCSSHDEPAKPLNLVGLTGKHPEEAELAFSKAYILWHGYRPTNLTDPDVCTNPAKAVELLSQAIMTSPAFYEAYMYRALAHKDLKEYGKALYDINAAIHFKKTPNALAFRALILTHQNKFSEAQADIDKAMEMDDDLPLPWKYLGFLQQRMGLQEDACKSYSRACSYGECSFFKKAQADGYCPS